VSITKCETMYYPSFLNTGLSVFLVSVAFAIYFYAGQSQRMTGFFIDRNGSDKGQIYLILFQRLLGVLLFGVLPVMIILLVYKIPLASFGYLFKLNIKSFFWIAAIGVIIFLINFFVSASKNNLSRYPQIRTLQWSVALLILSALSWGAYLLAYEFMFRGFLFFSCVKELGPFAAIMINISLYSLVHLHKGLNEALGALLFGLILCILTLRFGTIWAAFWLHCIMALSNEWMSIKSNPEIKVL
jgi:membrane protease YdiL (CAAX protease family)